ncbi:MAG: AAA family ATPase [Anaerolineae bacterium]|nr:AAA family ATPase [Anaerolineae bacterium]
MATPLLATKLYIPPPRPNLVLRPRLIERLDEGLRQGRKLTLVSAPAGFGKTTLVSEWIHTSGTRRVAWLSLDEGDSDPGRFFTYLVAALQGIDPAIGQEVQHLLEAAQPSIEPLVAALINDIAAAPAPIVLVLDDYHTLTEPAVHRAVALLLERQPPSLHLVIVTRHDPPLPLPLLRGRGEITEIRQNNLRFTAEEVAAFLERSMGLHISPSGGAALEEHTEGWIAGLQMAALSMQNRDEEGAARFIDGFSGRHHFILDYLTDEVLRQQPEPMQAFLLCTAILERLCGPLCDAVRFGVAETPRSSFGTAAVLDSAFSGQQILEYLERANLFIVPLDDERHWYRYHRLFSDLLRVRLLETQPGRSIELHRRAAVWHDANGFAAEAIRHALEAGDSSLAADVAERAARKITTWSRLDAATFLDWLDALPQEAVRARPWLRLFASRSLYVTGRREAGERMLDDFERSLEKGDSPETAHLLETVAADRASYAVVRGEVAQAADYARRALARLPEDSPSRARPASILGLAALRAGWVAEAREAFSQAIAVIKAAGIPFAAAPLMCNLAEVQFVQGQLRRAAQTCEEAAQMGTLDGAPTPSVGFVGLEMAQIAYEQNDLEAAEHHIVTGLELLRRGRIALGLERVYATLARVRQAQGDGEGATVAIQKATEIVKGHDIPYLSILVSAYQTRLWLAQDRTELAGRWARDYRKVGETEVLREFEDLTLARVLLAQDVPNEALALLQKLLPQAESAGRMGRAVEMYALQALALQMLGEGKRALDGLARALELAEPEGYARLFVETGEPMAALLREAAARGVAPAYVTGLLGAFSPSAHASITSYAQPLAEPLTERELEVLHLIAEGLTNPEIAQHLFISLPTVKSHARNIYGKLGVHRRRQAVAQARALGILPPR